MKLAMTIAGWIKSVRAQTKAGRILCRRGTAMYVGLALWGGVIWCSAQTATVTIQANAPGKPISPHLFGVFFEDLNYAADGGLYAELVQNRSFEYSPTEQPDWHPLKFRDEVRRGGADGYLRVENARPIHENNPHYVLIVVRNPGDGYGLANMGFDCIPVIAGEKYNFSFWAYQAFMGEMWGRGDQSRPMPVTVRLETRAGEVLAEAAFEVSGRQWRRLSTTLIPARSASDAQLVLLAHAQGGLCVDMISLFPERTFRNRPNGLRADLAQAIADLKPGFVRFPGGCLVHGLGFQHFYNWKESVGPIEQRRARRNVWGYHQTRGLGYFELFQFCEDIGALPIPVVPAGVTCQHAGSSPNRGQEGLPPEKMQELIQDILDLIEWANGPATSRWGGVRAAAGHPEPFGLKYLGVGNEEEITPAFKERFAMIYRAVKEKHPEIVVIGTVGPFASGRDYEEGWKFARELGLEMVDEHYYVSPQWFWDNLLRYDRYDRAGPRVYVGEYAAHDRDRRCNTLRSAIAEAAGMTAFERNGDVVQFASYAPLLARRGHTQWHPDLIYFDATNVYLTANYYVQMLFGQNRGDRYLPTLVESTGEGVKLTASAVRDSKSGDLIIKIVNGAEAPVRLAVKLVGLTAAELRGTRILLIGPSPDAFNEDGKEPVIRPAKTDALVKPEFEYEAPAWSLTVFRLNDR